jgi:hypothetical protein
MADRALALIVMWNLPIGRRPTPKKDPARCPQHGGKRESSGNTGQKLGNGVAAEVCWQAFLPARTSPAELHRVRARAIDVMSLPSAQPAVPIPDQGRPAGCAGGFCVRTFYHDFVIVSS